MEWLGLIDDGGVAHLNKPALGREKGLIAGQKTREAFFQG